VQQKKEKKKPEVDPWGIVTFNKEISKAFPEKLDWNGL